MWKQASALISSFAVFVLSGCAAGPNTWVSPEGETIPKSMAVYIEPIVVGNPSDLRDDLGMDSSGLARWLRPYLASALKSGSGVDSIVWLDRIDTYRDTLNLGKRRYFFKRPVDSLPHERVLVISYASTDRIKELSSTTFNGIQTGSLSLQLYMHYRLLDGSGRRNFAYGRVWERSKFILHMDRTDWDKVATSVSQQVARNISMRSSKSKTAAKKASTSGR